MSRKASRSGQTFNDCAACCAAFSVRGLFTLIEVLLTMILLTIVTAVLVSAFHVGLMSYGKAWNKERRDAELAGAVAFLRSDLARFVPVKDRRAVFAQASVSFFAFSASKPSHLELLDYSLAGKALVRRVTSFQDKRLSDDWAESSSTVVLKDVKALLFNAQGDQPIAPPQSAATQDAGAGGVVGAGASPPAGGSGTADDASSFHWPLTLSLVVQLAGGDPVSECLALPLFASVPDDSSAASQDSSGAGQ